MPALTRTQVDDVKLMALSLATDCTSSCICPVCSKKNFYVTRNATGLLYICHRVSCGIKGFISTGPNMLDIIKTPKKEHVFTSKVQPLPEKTKLWLCDQYGLTLEALHNAKWKYTTEGNRLVMPILNLFGHEIGIATKRLSRKVLPLGIEMAASDDTLPKVMTYPFDTSSPLVYIAPKPVHNMTLVVCEDIISAVRIGQYTNAAALLGTHMTTEAASHLAHVFGHVVLALDPDAKRKALKIQEQYGLMFRTFEIKYLSKDPKDVSDEELKRELLN